MFNNFFSENFAVYGIMWRNNATHATDEKTAHVFCITKTTDTHSEYTMFFAFYTNNG